MRASTLFYLQLLKIIRRQHFEDMPFAALPFVYRHCSYSTLCGCSFQSCGS